MSKPAFECLYLVHFGLGLVVGEIRSDGEAAEMKESVACGCSHSPLTLFRAQPPIHCSTGDNLVLDLTNRTNESYL